VEFIDLPEDARLEIREWLLSENVVETNYTGEALPPEPAPPLRAARTDKWTNLVGELTSPPAVDDPVENDPQTALRPIASARPMPAEAPAVPPIREPAALEAPIVASEESAESKVETCLAQAEALTNDATEWHAEPDASAKSKIVSPFAPLETTAAYGPSSQRSSSELSLPSVTLLNTPLYQIASARPTPAEAPPMPEPAPLEAPIVAREESAESKVETSFALAEALTNDAAEWRAEPDASAESKVESPFAPLETTAADNACYRRSGAELSLPSDTRLNTPLHPIAMYKHFFGLREAPFNLNPDPRYLFLTPQTQEALDELTYGIQTRKGLILLTGEVGTGKTTILNHLLDLLHEQQTPTASILNSYLESSHLFDFILADFGVPSDAGPKGNALLRLNQWLLERFRAGETPVLIVDEAQGLPTHLLEAIRMLMNLETPREKLLQIVLAGQPELEDRLNLPELRQIKQRIALRCKTAALTLEETRDYIHARLHLAGSSEKLVFAPEAVDAVYFYSRGIPRVMNLLCEHALINAYVDHVQPVPVHIVAEVAREFQFDDIRPVAPLIRSEASAECNVAAERSQFMNELVSLAANAELFSEEHPSALKTRVFAPFIAADRALRAVEAMTTPGLKLDIYPKAAGSGKAIAPMSVDASVPDAPGPRESEASGYSELSAFFLDVGVRFSPWGVMKPASHRLTSQVSTIEANGRNGVLPTSRSSHPTVPRTVRHPRTKSGTGKLDPSPASAMRSVARNLFAALKSTAWRNHFSHLVAAPAWSDSTRDLPLRLKRWIQPVGARYLSGLASSGRRLFKAGGIDWPRVEASLVRWLRQPWNPVPWRLTVSRLFEIRRRFIHKRV
jgi:general secretion pathway protein A